jgi:hypothetical protein
MTFSFVYHGKEDKPTKGRIKISTNKKFPSHSTCIDDISSLLDVCA